MLPSSMAAAGSSATLRAAATTTLSCRRNGILCRRNGCLITSRRERTGGPITILTAALNVLLVRFATGATPSTTTPKQNRSPSGTWDARSAMAQAANTLSILQWTTLSTQQNSTICVEMTSACNATRREGHLRNPSKVNTMTGLSATSRESTSQISGGSKNPNWGRRISTTGPTAQHTRTACRATILCTATCTTAASAASIATTCTAAAILLTWSPPAMSFASAVIPKTIRQD